MGQTIAAKLDLLRAIDAQIEARKLYKKVKVSLPPNESADACSNAVWKTVKNNTYQCYEVTDDEHKAVKEQIAQLEYYLKHVQPTIKSLQGLCEDARALMDNVVEAEPDDLGGIGKRKRDDDLGDLKEAAEEILRLVKKIRVESGKVDSPGKDSDSERTAVSET